MIFKYPQLSGNRIAAIAALPMALLLAFSSLPPSSPLSFFLTHCLAEWAVRSLSFTALVE